MDARAPVEYEARVSPVQEPRTQPFAVQRRGHIRLVLFFLALALAGSVAGTFLLVRVGAPDEAGAVLVACVFGVAGAGAFGVFVHRRTIAKARWQETQAYLARIQQASDKYRALMEGAADMLLVVEPATGRVREGNLLAREQLEHGAELPAVRPTELAPAEIAAGPAIERVFAASELERVRAALAEAAASPGRPHSLAGIRLLGAHGRTLDADARLAALDLDGERVVHVALRDLTLQKEMERALAIQERLSSIGLLTAGVAHEINNPLEGIGNYVALLEREDLPAADRRRYLELVRHGFQRIGDIVRDLLRFARPVSDAGTAELGGVVERAVKLVRYTDVYRNIEVETQGFEQPLVVTGDAGRLEQIVFNLLLNAGQAIAAAPRGTGSSTGGVAGGRVCVRATIAETRGARAIELAVEDDGAGIAPAHLEKLFDPFFTTRDGTGLGLAVSYGIARAHGGTLSAENRSTGGARFVLRLPWPAETRAANENERRR
jgi:signal transduction histidine kinase